METVAPIGIFECAFIHFPQKLILFVTNFTAIHRKQAVADLFFYFLIDFVPNSLYTWLR